MPNPEDLREIAPTAARGHNIVLVTPPSPAYIAPVLGGVLDTLRDGRRGLLLCPAAEVDEWGAVAYARAGASAGAAAGTPRIQVAHGTARAGRQLLAGGADLLIAAPDTASALLQRAALKAESLASLILAWPETWADEADDLLAPLMQDLPKESQRLIVTSAPERVQALVERYARKALTVGLSAPDTPAVAPAGPVRTVVVPWHRRVAALADLLEILDPASLVVWTADTTRHDEIGRAVPLAAPGIQVVTGDAPAAEVVVAFDLPTPDRLRQLLAAGEVILLVPPSASAYVDRIAAPCRPLRLPGALETATTAAGVRRAAVVRALEAGHPDHALLALAPLFERYDPAAVAAALFDLWTAADRNLPPPIPDIAATARVYLGLGKKDGVTVNDVVGTLTKEVRVERTKIGKIELRDAYTLIELPAQEAEAIARALNGTTIRRKRVTARIDRGRETTPRERGPGRGAGRPRTPAPSGRSPTRR